MLVFKNKIVKMQDIDLFSLSKKQLKKICKENKIRTKWWYDKLYLIEIICDVYLEYLLQQVRILND